MRCLYGSNIIYSDDNPENKSPANIKQIDASSIVYGNVFVLANKFTIEAGSEINGDLYIIAREMNINPKATIYGNVFALAGTCNFNGVVVMSFQGNCRDFNMGYDGTVSQNLKLSAQNVNLNGLISKDSYITAESLATNIDFINRGNLNFSAHDIKFVGQIGTVESPTNITLNAENLEFTDIENTTIIGDLNYSTPSELANIPVVQSGNVSFAQYSNVSGSSNHSISDMAINLISTIIYTILVYLLVVKLFKMSFDGKKVSVKNMLVALGIGLILMIATLVSAILLYITYIGIALIPILVLLYALLLLISTPYFITTLSVWVKEKFNSKIKLIPYILITTLTTWLLCLIPVVGTVITILELSIGSGMIFLQLIGKHD